MSRDYGALRLWSTVLVSVGVAGVIFVVTGIIFAMIEAVTFGQALALLLIGGPLAALFASWPIALGQGLRALAEYVQEQQGKVKFDEMEIQSCCAASRPSSRRDGDLSARTAQITRADSLSKGSTSGLVW